MKPTVTEDPSVAPPSFDARAAIVNRTHRVVRQRAQAIEARKRRVRDLVIPFLICSAVLVLIANAVWTIGDDSLVELEGGLWRRVMELGGDAGSNISILLVWFLPISILTAAIVLFRRNRTGNSFGQERL